MVYNTKEVIKFYPGFITRNYLTSVNILLMMVSHYLSQHCKITVFKLPFVSVIYVGI